MAAPFEIFTKLPNLSRTFSETVPQPSIYGNSIIISTNETELNAGIYRYDPQTNKLHLLHKYKYNLVDTMIYDHTQFLDLNSGNLYLFGGPINSNLFIKFNLNTKEFNYNIPNKLRDCSAYSQIIRIINNIHIFSSGGHHVARIDNNNIVQTFAEFLDEDDGFGKPIYIPIKKQLISFGVSIINENNQLKIAFKDIDCITDIDKQWNIHSLNMPHTEDIYNFNVLLAFKSLIFVFYLHEKDIWCLDINLNKWYKSKHKIPSYIDGYINIIKGKHNFIDIYSFKQGYHLKTSLHDIIPDDLKKYYSEYYEPLVVGYLKNAENKIILANIPYVLKQLIWKFLPAFV